MGAAINARMGLNTWAAFYGSDADAEIARQDVAEVPRELDPQRLVVAQLDAHRLDRFIGASHQDLSKQLQAQPPVKTLAGQNSL